jgi:hypothetical protein
MERRAPKAYRVKMRAFAKFALQFKHEKQLIELAVVAAGGMMLARNANSRRMFLLTAATCIVEIYRINTIVRGLILPIEQRVVLFATQNEALFPLNHRFRLHNMRKLAYCLRIPANFTLDNGSFVQGEHALIIFLRLLATYNRLTDVEIELGFELTTLSRIRTAVLNHLYDLHKHRVTDYLHWHMQFLPAYQTAIQRYKIRMSGSMPHRTRNTCVLMDGHRHKVARASAVAVSFIYSFNCFSSCSPFLKSGV